MNKEEQIGTLVGLDLILSPEHYKEINDLKEENKQLKQRIDKAIEYIKFEWQEIIGNENYSNHLWTIDGLVIKRLLKILGDKENEKE